MARALARALPLCLFALMALACGEDRDNQKAKQRLWGRETVPTEVENLAKEPLDAAMLADDQKTRSRILGMGMDELYARFGFFRYEGLAKLELERGGQRLAVEEKSVIEHGLHGDFRVEQTGEEGKPLREIVYHGGILFIRNGGGELRVQGIVNRQHKVVRDEAWQPLNVYTAYFGERLGLRSAGTAHHHGRNAQKYKLGLAPGPELVGQGSKDGPKKPISLEGELWVDAETAVPVKCRLVGVLEVPGKKREETKTATSAIASSPATLSISLDMSLVAAEGKELKPEKFIPTIRRHPTDLEPLAFLEGETKTSTVIGGPKAADPKKPGGESAKSSAPDAGGADASAAPAKPTATPAKPTKPAKPGKKKKKKKKDQ